jgi:glutamyl-tRNA synthetase
MKTVRTRIAPSPTGFPHIGTVYQVLFDFAYARQNKGKFILRLEDTDRNRFVEGAEEVIYKSLDWFNLNPDEDPIKGGPFAPYRQSERLDIYHKYAEELLNSGNAYYCFCTKEKLDEMRKNQEANHQAPMYDKTCRNLKSEEVKEKLSQKIPHVIRMKVPENRQIIVKDEIIGNITFDSNVIDDQVIIKSDGFPTYHFAVVIDDNLMEITHIFRGREWISSTPKHILLYEFFGWTPPKHAHLALILNEDGKGKLSKRHGHASVDYYRNLGYLPEAVLNYLSNIVWNHPKGKEIYSLDEFIKLLDISKITSQAARFNLAKLDWVNKEYIKSKSEDELFKLITDFEKRLSGIDPKLVKRIIPLVHERMAKLSEFWSLTSFFFNCPDSFERPLDKNKIQMLKDILGSSEWTHAAMEEAIRKIAEEKVIKAKDLFMELRLAITGKSVGPPLLESLEILGKEETIKRLDIK